MSKKIIINGEIFGSVDKAGASHVFNIPVQKHLKCGVAYLIEFEIYDEASCKGIIQLEECENDIELWTFNIACISEEVDVWKMEIEFYQFYKIGMDKYKIMIKDGYIPSEFRLEEKEKNRLYALYYLAWKSDKESVALKIAEHGDFGMLIEVSEELAREFPTLKNIIEPDVYNEWED